MVTERLRQLRAQRDRALIFEQATHAALFQQRRLQLGDQPQKRLAWLLDFAYRLDVGQLAAEALAGLRYDLLIVVQEATDGRWTFPSAPTEIVDHVGPRDAPAKRARLLKSFQLDLEIARAMGDDAFSVQLSRQHVDRAELQQAQAGVREALEALVGGRLYTPMFSVLPRRLARQGPAQIPAPPTPRRRFVVVSMIIASLRDAVVEAAIELLSQTPPGAVRRCEPDPSFGVRCSQVFVGERRQKYCAAHRDVIRQAQVQLAVERFREKAKKRQRKTAKSSTRVRRTASASSR